MSMSPERKAKKAESMRLWRIRNADHIKQYKATFGKQKNAEYRERNREKLRQKNKEYRLKNKEKIKEKRSSEEFKKHIREYAKKHYQLNKKRKMEIAKKYELKNIDKVKKMRSDWKKRNAHKVRESSMRRLVCKRKAMPKWVDIEQIKCFYEVADRVTKQTGVKHDVDHIVPLVSNVVCGLHVQENLQLLVKADNIRKGNRIWPDMP